jgi:hypothetical protein
MYHAREGHIFPETYTHMEERTLLLVILVNGLPATGTTTLVRRLGGATIALLFMLLREQARPTLAQ